MQNGSRWRKLRDFNMRDQELAGLIIAITAIIAIIAITAITAVIAVIAITAIKTIIAIVAIIAITIAAVPDVRREARQAQLRWVRAIVTEARATTPNLPTNITPAYIARLKLSGKSPLDLGIPPV